jgi:Flp pilus assembly protein TadD
MASSQSPSSEELIARGVAGRVLHDLEGDHSTTAVHAKAVALLLRDNARAAIPLLRTCTRFTPRDARVWNDLAAALYIHGQDDAETHEALAAARHAIQLDPRLAEAYFNIALILERSGTKTEVRAAWSDYLRIDSSSGWAEEAKNRLALYHDGS